MKLIAIGAASAAALALAATAYAAAPHALLGADPGNSISYRVVFDGSFWNGQKVGFTRDATITVGQNKAVHLVSTGAAPTDNAQFDGTVDADGIVSASNAGSNLASYNTVAGLLKGAPAQLAAGSTWDASVPIQTGNGSQFTPLPVKVTVASADANGIILQGTGAQSMQATFSGYTVPIDVQVRFAVRMLPAGFDRCDFDAAEVVHAGPQTQNMKWKWSLTRQQAAKG